MSCIRAIMGEEGSFFNIVRCGAGLCLEYDCTAREIAESILGLEAREDGEVCVSALPHEDVDEAVNLLESGGVPRYRIAVEGRPLAMNIERVRAPSLRVCPVCGSVRVSAVGVIGLTPPLYVCANCGYRGSIIVEVSLQP